MSEVTSNWPDYSILAYGYSLANNKKYIAVGGPSFYGCTTMTSSVNVLNFSETLNEYVLYATFKEEYGDSKVTILLSDEASNNFISTEDNKDFLISTLEQVSSYSNRFGYSLALYNDILAVGNDAYTYLLDNGTILTGSSVSIYDLPTKTLTYTINYFDDSTFGESISMYGDYLAVGSSSPNDNTGNVYIYKNTAGTYSLHQTLNGSNTTIGSYFGGSVKFDQSGSYRLLVGNSNTTSNNCEVYIFDLNTGSGNWEESDILIRNTSIPQTLPFLDDVSPYILNNSSIDGFGNSVSLFGENVIIGAPRDTTYLEYEGSSVTRYRGAVYFYQKCSDNNRWQLIQKSWGDKDILKTNRFGYKVDMYDDTAIASLVKFNFPFSSSYIMNTLNRKNEECNPDYVDISTLGQAAVYKLDTSSSIWNIKKVIQKKKEYLYPYTVFGYSAAIYDGVYAIGSPLLLSDIEYLYRESHTKGYVYIYNENDLMDNFQVGNVFYRNGKFIFSNSGSMFNDIMKDEINPQNPIYDISYDGKLNLYEKQVVCTIEPNEFNVSTNPTSMVNNEFFKFKDLDYILKYMSYKLYGDQYWWNYLEFTEVEDSLFSLYIENYNIYNENALTKETELASKYPLGDVDGNNRIDVSDMYLLWKVYTNGLDEYNVFKYIEPKSRRKTVTDIKGYIQNNIFIQNYGTINPLFADFNYSSSIDRTGSYLAPYITTVGLYNGADLVAVAKLATPIKNSGEYPLNILVKWDF